MLSVPSIEQIVSENVNFTFFEKSKLPFDMSNWSLSNFSISYEIHKGSASYVYKAYLNESNFRVALKIYRLKKLDPIQRFQLFREIRIHSILDHPNIIEVFGIFKEGNVIVFVEEFLKKGDLYRILFQKNHVMSKEFILQSIIKPILSALQYLHSNNIIHRDIKLENILVDESWKVKLCDFGLSINTSEELPVTRVGTKDYLAPEVSKCPFKKTPEENKNNTSYAYNQKVDVYSLGILIFELMTKTTPKPGNPIKFPDNMDDNIKNLISSMTSHLPIKRPEIVDILENPLFNQS